MPELTTVVSIRGLNPAEWLADPRHRYVGRRCGSWPASIWGNPWKPKDFDSGYVGWQAIGHGWPTHWCPLPETKRKQKDYCRRWSKPPCPPSA